MIYSLLPRNRDVKGSFNAGVFGKISKIVTVVFSLFTVVIYSFPVYMPVTATSKSSSVLIAPLACAYRCLIIGMNYFAGILGVFGLFAVLDWFLRARKSFNVRETQGSG